MPAPCRVKSSVTPGEVRAFGQFRGRDQDKWREVLSEAS